MEQTIYMNHWHEKSQIRRWKTVWNRWSLNQTFLICGWPWQPIHTLSVAEEIRRCLTTFRFSERKSFQKGFGLVVGSLSVLTHDFALVLLVLTVAWLDVSKWISICNKPAPLTLTHTTDRVVGIVFCQEVRLLLHLPTVIAFPLLSMR